MRIKVLFISIVLVSLLGCAKKNQVTETLWYETPAKDWYEAIPLGNGRLGAMVFGTPEEERLQLNEESLWAGCPEDPYPDDVQKHYAEFQRLNLVGKYDEAMSYAMENLAVSPTGIRSYEPLGDLYINFKQKNSDNYKRSLGLEEGIATVEYEIDGNKFRREAFISSEYNAIFYHFSSMNDTPVNCDIRFEREKDIQQFIDENNILVVDGQVFDDPGGYDDNAGGSGKGGHHMKFTTHVGVQLSDGEVSSKDGRLTVSNANDFTIVVSAVTDYNLDIMNYDCSIDSKKRSSTILTTALNTPYQQIKKEHIQEHAEVYNRVDFEIAGITVDTIPTNKRLENLALGKNDNYLTQLFFQYGRYLLMSSSGAQSKLPANLQGIWNKDMWAAWEADFHLNINLQMNYWPADVCNLSETFDPLSNFMVQLSEKGKTTADKYIGSEGWMAHHATNPFGRTTPSGSTKSSQVNNGYCFPLAGAWMSLSMWRHYEFNRDKAYLEKTAYPIIRGAAQFILDFLIENEKGELVTAPSYSPENSYIDPVSGKRLRNTTGATIDIQIIRDIFKACIVSEEVLAKSDLTKQVQDALQKLPKTKIGADGTIREWIEDYKEAEPGHRHISHLFALYPSNQITKETPELFEAAKRTIERRLSKGGGQTGWSRAWMINFYARLFDGDECQKYITGLIRNHVAFNLFDLHPPHIFQIDGNLGATAGIAEMLLQSHEENTIRLLPALPSSWPTGHIKGLKARGGFEVDIYWKNNQLKKAVIHAKKEGKAKLVYQNKYADVELKEGEEFVFD